MKSPMTPRGYNFLRKELQRLKALRPEIANAIEVARGLGDLSENADYDAAKERSGMNEAKIRDFEARLSRADIVDPLKLGTPRKVMFGTTVTIQDIESDEQKTLSIYGGEESDIEKGWISFESPLARQLIGKEESDVVKVTLPGGSKEYEIISISVTYEYTEEPTEG
jgi:transcription elongation factor GreA